MSSEPGPNSEFMGRVRRWFRNLLRALLIFIVVGLAIIFTLAETLLSGLVFWSDSIAISSARTRVERRDEGWWREFDQRVEDWRVRDAIGRNEPRNDPIVRAVVQEPLSCIPVEEYADRRLWKALRRAAAVRLAVALVFFVAGIRLLCGREAARRWIVASALVFVIVTAFEAGVISTELRSTLDDLRRDHGVAHREFVSRAGLARSFPDPPQPTGIVEDQQTVAVWAAQYHGLRSGFWQLLAGLALFLRMRNPRGDRSAPAKTDDEGAEAPVATN